MHRKLFILYARFLDHNSIDKNHCSSRQIDDMSCDETLILLPREILFVSNLQIACLRGVNSRPKVKNMRVVIPIDRESITIRHAIRIVKLERQNLTHEFPRREKHC